jgi:hypothetical protein
VVDGSLTNVPPKVRDELGPAGIVILPDKMGLGEGAFSPLGD